MSKEYPTVNETIAYEDGFADAKDYWVAKEQERIIKLLEDYQSKKCNDYECFSGSNRNVHDYECGVDELERLVALIKGEK